MKNNLFCAVFATLVSINAFSMEGLYNQKTEKIVPIGCKNFPVPQKSLDGICANSAKFQLWVAGLHALCPENLHKKITSDITDSVYQEINPKYHPESDKLLPMTKRYLSQQYSHKEPFIFSPDEIEKEGIIDCWERGYVPLTWKNLGGNEGNYLVKQIQYGSYKGKRKGKETLKEVLESRCFAEAKSPLVFVKLLYDNKKMDFEMLKIEDLSDFEMPEIPLSFKVQNNAKKNDSDTIKYQDYQLIGVGLTHFYELKKNNFSLFFSHIFDNVMPSGHIIHRFNHTFATHIDAYVKYNDSWYVMDDEIRWKASVRKSNLENNSSKNSDSVGLALTKCYPGIPYVLAYAPVLHQDEMECTKDEVLHKLSLTLTRETKVPSCFKPAVALCCGGAADGALVTFISYILQDIIAHETGIENPSKMCYAIAFGLVVGLGVAVYHASLLMPHHYSEINYNSEDTSHLGPRERSDIFRSIMK